MLDRFYLFFGFVYGLIGVNHTISYGFGIWSVPSLMVAAFCTWFAYKFPRKFPDLYAKKKDAEPREYPENADAKGNEHDLVVSSVFDLSPLPQDSHDPVRDDKDKKD